MILTIQKIFLFHTLLLIATTSWTADIDQPQVAWSETAVLTSKSLLLDIANTGSQLVAVGERGHILTSDNCGNSWMQSRVQTRATINAVYFLNENTGWAVGHDSVILKTIDRGKNWILLFSDAAAEQPLFDVWFSDELHGYAIGAYGLFMETSDGGNSWSKRQISSDDFHLYSLTVNKSGAMIIAGESGSLYRSSDNGKAWERLESPYEGSFFGVLPLQDSRLIAYGMRGNIFITGDLGNTWSSIKTDNKSSLGGGYLLDDGSIYLVGNNGVMLTSKDSGKSFSVSISKQRRDYSTLAQCNGDTLVVVGDTGAERIKR